MNVVVNFLMFQAGWFACVLLGASTRPWLGPVVVLLLLAAHLAASPDRSAEWRLMAWALLIGIVWENLLTLTGLTVYPTGQPFGRFAPVWILAMWPLLAMTLNASMRWLRGRALLSVLFGAIGGPLAFLAGERLGAVVFADTALAMAVLAVGWALLFPLLMALSGRTAGLGSASRPALEVAT